MIVAGVAFASAFGFFQGQVELISLIAGDLVSFEQAAIVLDDGVAGVEMFESDWHLFH